MFGGDLGRGAARTEALFSRDNRASRATSDCGNESGDMVLAVVLMLVKNEKLISKK